MNILSMFPKRKNGDDEQRNREEIRRCVKEIDEVLQRHNCQLVVEDVYHDGKLISHRIRVLKPNLIITPPAGANITKQ